MSPTLLLLSALLGSRATYEKIFGSPAAKCFTSFIVSPLKTAARTHQLLEQMSRKYVSANHRFAECVFTLQLYFSLCSVLKFIPWQLCAYAPVRFRHKKHLVRVRKGSYFCLKYLLLSPRTAGNSLQVFFRISNGLTLTNVGTQSQTVVTETVVSLLNSTTVTLRPTWQ